VILEDRNCAETWSKLIIKYIIYRTMPLFVNDLEFRQISGFLHQLTSLTSQKIFYCGGGGGGGGGDGGDGGVGGGDGG
jgi:hypothetical protein